LIKTDAEGTKEWETTFGSNITGDQCFSPYCFETEDGGFLIDAWVGGFLGVGRSDLWIIKTDADGNMEWNDTFGTEKDDATWCMNEGQENGYVFLETIDYTMTGDSDIWVIKTDDQGNAFWTAKIDDPAVDEVGQNIKKTSDGGYIIVGRTGQYNVYTVDALVVKLGPEQTTEMPTLTVKRPKPSWIYLFNLIGFPFPLTPDALVLGDLTFKAKAEHTDGIEKVEFFVNGLKVGESNTTQGLLGTYNFDWSGAEKGTYTIKIRAYSTIGGTDKTTVTLKKIR
jgi:hypothetical protein